MLRHWFFMVLATIRLTTAYAGAYWHVRYGLKRAVNLPETVVLTVQEKRRWRHYYLGVTYLSVLFCTLRGQRRSHQEQFLFSNLAALSSFFDDLVDGQRNRALVEGAMPTEYLAFGALTDDRGLARRLLDTVSEKLPPTHLSSFQFYLQRVFAVEMKGQTVKDDLKALAGITAEKGSCSVLLFRLLMEPLPAGQEQRALSAFGHLIQLSDDIFDVWFDLQAAVETQATLLIKSGRVGELHALFERQLKVTKDAFWDVPVSKWRIRIALAVLHTLTAITRTCLFRYRQQEIVPGQIGLLDREQWVVDMEEANNRIRAARYLLLSR